MANPAMPVSESGVLNTRSDPNSSRRPVEHRKTPPNPTSSPKTMVDGSVSKAVCMAELMAVNRFIFVLFGKSSSKFGSGMDDQDVKVLGPSLPEPGAVTKEENSWSTLDWISVRDVAAAAAALNGRVAPGVVITNDDENSFCFSFSPLQESSDKVEKAPADSEAAMALLSRRIKHRFASAMG